MSVHTLKQMPGARIADPLDRKVMSRFAPILTGSLGASAGSLAADALAHDAEDYAAEDVRWIRESIASMPPGLQQAVLGTVGATTGVAPRQLVMAALAGAPVEEVMARAQGGSKELKMAIKNGAQLAATSPEVATMAAAFGKKMSDFETQAEGIGREPIEIVTAMNEGTVGHSPLPAILGGAGLGTGTALLHHLMAKRAVAQ